MAHQWSRANLLATEFPMLSTLWGETVMNPSGDMPNAAFGSDDINKPRCYYMENVMPTSAGYQSIGWDIIANTPAGGVTTSRFFNEIFEIKIPNIATGPGIPEYISLYIATPFTALGGVWILQPNGGVWAFVATPVVSDSSPMQLSTAFVQGQTYIYMSGKGCFYYNLSTLAFVSVTLLGVTAANILGITQSNGYMIAYGSDAILWSSLVNPLDFIPSLVTGAGGGNISEIKESIVGCYNIAGGFIVYTADNAVQASYTGNAQFPFKFQEIPGSGGIFSDARLSWQDSSSVHYVYSNKGLMSIQLGTDAKQLFPEVTEMLTAGYTEKFDRVNKVFTYTSVPLSSAPQPILNIVASRYFVISYDAELINPPGGGQYRNYSRALVYDSLLQRWGKIVKDHVDIIDFENFDTTAIIEQSPRATLGLIDHLGNFYKLNMDFTSAIGSTGQGNSVLLLGKFQLQRNRGIYLQRVKFENLISGQTWNCYALPTYDGNTIQPAVQLTNLSAADEESGGNVQTFGGRVYGKNVSVLLIGNFNLSSAAVDLVIGADD